MYNEWLKQFPKPSIEGLIFGMTLAIIYLVIRGYGS